MEVCATTVHFILPFCTFFVCLNATLDIHFLPSIHNYYPRYEKFVNFVMEVCVTTVPLTVCAASHFCFKYCVVVCHICCCAIDRLTSFIYYGDAAQTLSHCLSNFRPLCTLLTFTIHSHKHPIIRFGLLVLLDLWYLEQSRSGIHWQWVGVSVKFWLHTLKIQKARMMSAFTVNTQEIMSWPVWSK